MAQTADGRHQPFRIGILVAADIDPVPGHVAAAGEVRIGDVGLALVVLAAFLLPLHAVVVIDVLGGRQLLLVKADQGGSDLLGRGLFEQLAAEGQHVLILDRRGQDGVGQHTFAVVLEDHLGRRRARPFGLDRGRLQHQLDLAAARIADQKDRDALLAGASGAARTMQQPGLVDRDFGMDDQSEIRQIQTARSDIGGDTNSGMAVPQCLQGLRALALGQLAGQADDRKPPLAQAGGQVLHPLAGVGEHQGTGGLEIAEHIDDRELDLVRGDANGLVFDVGVGRVAGDRIDPQGVALIGLGQLHDVARQRGREHQGAALGRGGLEDEGQVLMKAHVEHFVGFIEDDRLQRRQVQRTALEMVAQATGGADDDMAAAVQRLTFDLGVHAADAGDDARAGLGIEPLQFVGDLQCQFAGGSNDQGHRRAELREFLGLAEQGRRKRQTEGDGLAGSGLGGNEQIAALFCLQHGGLHRRGLGIAALGKGAVERRMAGGEGHGAVQ